MSDHAELSPSAANRWLNCTASIEFCRGYGDEDESEWSLEGTDAHEKLELWLSLGVPPTDGILYDHLANAYEYALDLEERGFDVSFEQRVTYDETLWGTVDILGIKRNTLAIADYKHGYRAVEAQGNAQMLTYASCVTAEYEREFSDVTLTIIQPRINHIDGPVRSWGTTGSFVEWHTSEINIAKRQIYGPNPKFLAGKHCKFCPREGDCKVNADHVAKLVSGSPLFKDDVEDLL